jgi:hypothetical protein
MAYAIRGVVTIGLQNMYCAKPLSRQVREHCRFRA